MHTRGGNGTYFRKKPSGIVDAMEEGDESRNPADQQMADGTVRIVREAGMEEQCVLISLDYDLINYTEKTYPEIQTGYLTFLSFGNTAALNCDYLGLEEESATSAAIEAVHKQGKKVLV